MTASFLDTTVIVHAAGEPSDTKCKAEEIIKEYQPATTPYYALRELMAGHLRILCDAHNIINSTDNPAEALIALLNISPAQGRKKEARIQAVANALRSCLGSNPSGSRDGLKREVLQSLAVRTNSIWRNAQRLSNVKLVQPLSCFTGGRLTLGASGELRGPGDSFNCLTSERCAAAAYLFDNQDDLSKMIDALHSNNLGQSLGNKRENTTRRKALKELLQHGPKQFNKNKCRALGDAYFAAMCPPGASVITSNTDDHIPLCNALNKKVVPL